MDGLLDYISVRQSLLSITLLILLFFYKAFKANNWPSAEMIVEVLAYSAGMYAAFTCILNAYNKCGIEEGSAIMMFTGAIVVGSASICGYRKLLNQLSAPVIPRHSVDRKDIDRKTTLDQSTNEGSKP